MADMIPIGLTKPQQEAQSSARQRAAIAASH